MGVGKARGKLVLDCLNPELGICVAERKIQMSKPEKQTIPSTPSSAPHSPDKSADLIEVYEKISGRSEKEMERVYTFYKRLVWSLTVISVAVVVSFGILYFQRWSELREEMNQKITTLESQVTTRVDSEISPEKISKLAKTKVDSVTEELIRAKAAEIIDPKFQTIDRRLTDAEESLSFDLQALLATRDSRRDFDGLRRFAANPASKYKDRAVEIVRSLSENSVTSTLITGGFKWASIGVDPDRVGLADITPHYRDLISAADKEVAFDVIWSSTKFSTFEKLNFAINDLMERDSSLAAVRSASNFAESYAKLKKTVADYPAYMEWWKVHREEFRNAK